MTNTPVDKTAIDALAADDKMFVSDTSASGVIKEYNPAQMATFVNTNLALGTMSTQDADAVAITGGAIDGTVIGGTTPAAMTGTALDLTRTGNGASSALILESTQPSITFKETGVTTDNGFWDIRTNGEAISFRLRNDAFSAATSWLSVARTGTTVDSVTLAATTIAASGALTANTLDTGQGANELHAMDQDVQIADSVTFAGLTATGVLNVDDTTDSSSITTGSAIIDGGAGIAKTLFVGTGVSLPTSGGTATVLDFFEDRDSVSTTFTGPWASGQVETVFYTRIGTTVTVFIDSNITAEATTAAVAISGTTDVPARFRPTQTRRGTYQVLDNGAILATPGMVRVRGSGDITFYLDWSNATFTGTGTTGVNSTFTFTYVI